MKWKLKALALATALSIVGSAHATIADSSTGNGELFFSIYDTVTLTSYTRDLGVTMDSFVTTAGGTTVSQPAFLQFVADPTLSSFLSSVSANAAGLLWNIGAADGSGQNRYLTTAAAMPGPSGSTSVMTNSQLVQLKGSADQFLSPTNGLGSHLTVANGSNTASAASDGVAYAGGSLWGNNWGGKALGINDTATGLGSTNSFWLLFQNGTATLNRSFYEAAGTWALASNGDLTFGTPPSAVPIPAAVWLLGSGLFGLVGVARRRQGKLAA